MYTWTSSNLSFTFDVDAVVGSGLDLLTMSIVDAEAEAATMRKPYWADCTSQPNVNFPVRTHMLACCFAAWITAGSLMSPPSLP
jgi:hypothetical protein